MLTLEFNIFGSVQLIRIGIVSIERGLIGGYIKGEHDTIKTVYQTHRSSPFRGQLTMEP